MLTLPVEEEKKCKSCMQKKNLKEFYANWRYKDGYNNRCKECILKQWRKPRKDDNDA